MNIDLREEDIISLSLKECNDILNEIRGFPFWNFTSKQSEVIRKIEDRKFYLEKNGFLSE